MKRPLQSKYDNSNSSSQYALQSLEYPCNKNRMCIESRCESVQVEDTVEGFDSILYHQPNPTSTTARSSILGVCNVTV